MLDESQFWEIVHDTLLLHEDVSMTLMSPPGVVVETIDGRMWRLSVVHINPDEE